MTNARQIFSEDTWRCGKKFHKHFSVVKEKATTKKWNATGTPQ